MTGRPTVMFTPASMPSTLTGPVALVVVHGDDEVEVAAPGAEEERVGGQRPVHVDAARPRRLRTAGSIFSASSPRPNRPFSPACGLMPQTPMRGRGDAGADERLVAAPDGALDQPRLDLRDRVDQADVRRDVDDPQLRRRQHHRDFRRAGQRGQQLGVAGEDVAAGVQRLLVERRGADRVDLARPIASATARSM